MPTAKPSNAAPDTMAADDEHSHDYGEDPISAFIDYAQASGQVVNDTLALFQSRLELSLMQLRAGALGGAIALVLLLSAWILAMVGLSQLLENWIEQPGLSILLVALLNCIAAAVAVQYSRNMLRRAAKFGRQDEVTQ